MYNHNDKLIGWTDVDLFDVEDSKIVLKEGKFALQLFNPPLLMPPFLGHTKTTSIIELKYVKDSIEWREFHKNKVVSYLRALI